MLACWTMACGCLIAPDIEEEPEEESFGPEIVLTSLNPPIAGVTTLLADCPSARVTFGKQGSQVRDLNLKDTLFLRWLLDWDESVSANGIWQTAIIFPSGHEERSLNSYVLNYSALAPITEGDFHTLTLFVSDRIPCGECNPPPCDDDDKCNGVGVKAGSDGTWDLYNWTLQMKDDGSWCDP